MEQPPSKHPKLDIQEEKLFGATFDKLPNEIVEISIKMALKGMNTQEKYNFLTEVIPNVSKRFKDISKHKSLWKGLSPIEMLPNDVAEVIIKMAITNTTKYRGPIPCKRTQNLLVDMIATVSSRFKTWAALRSFWKGAVWIHDMEGDERTIEQALEFVNDATTSLYLFRQYHGTGKSLEKLPIKCPQLERLHIMSPAMRSWPKFIVALSSLKWLDVGAIQENLFENIELHISLPNIEFLQLRVLNLNLSLMLPNMAMCVKLREIKLEGGKFNLKSVAYLPHGLKKLSGSNHPQVPLNIDITWVPHTPTCIIGVDRFELHKHLTDCQININFYSEATQISVIDPTQVSSISP